MPLINRSVSIAANAQNDNLLAGSAFEYLPSNAQLTFGIVQASGATGGILCTVQSGSDILMEEGPLVVRAGLPIRPDDFTLEDVALGGERIIIKARNTTAGAIIVNLSMIVQEI